MLDEGQSKEDTRGAFLSVMVLQHWTEKQHIYSKLYEKLVLKFCIHHLVKWAKYYYIRRCWSSSINLRECVWRLIVKHRMIKLRSVQCIYFPHNIPKNPLQLLWSHHLRLKMLQFVFLMFGERGKDDLIRWVGWMLNWTSWLAAMATTDLCLAK